MGTTTKERPILFSAPMVRAILEGRKTMTRRVVSPRLTPDGMWARDDSRGCERLFRHGEVAPRGAKPWWPIGGINGAISRCPYGVPGDMLWVRETWASDVDGCPAGLSYRADHLDPRGDGPANPMRWRPSIFMPRWASRITLEVTGVRVERLQDITAGDAECEGVDAAHCGRIDAFERLWDSINSSRGYGWTVNPWVWVVTFKVLDGKDGVR